MRGKLLVFWSWSDFKDVYQTAFVNHPDYEVELVSLSGEKQKQGMRLRDHAAKYVPLQSHTE
ncbi:MAG: hypothetical protein LV481_04735 [Methylacidiphilales bacterium]|nr:hypothetical protein [Candidatus Methylacidiphilales bacterium]